MNNRRLSFDSEDTPTFSKEKEAKLRQQLLNQIHYTSPQQTPTFPNQLEGQPKLNTKTEDGRQLNQVKNTNSQCDIYSLYSSYRHLQDFQHKIHSNISSSVLVLTTEEVIHLMQAPQDQRRSKEIRQLRNYFYEQEFFKKLMVLEGPEFVNSCIDHLSYKSFTEKSAIFNSGEIEPDLRGIMILLKGQSRIFYDRECSLKYTVGQKCNYQEMSRVITDGTTIGAYDLEQDNVRQNLQKVYSIVCDTFNSYAFLDKQVYSQLKLQKVRHEKRDLIEFFKTISIFNNFEEMTLVEVILQCERQTFNRMQYVYKEGEESGYIYVVFQGEFRLMVKNQTGKSIEQNQQKQNTQFEKSLQRVVPQQFIHNDNQTQMKLQQSNSIDEDNGKYHSQKLKDLYSLMQAKAIQQQIQRQEQMTLIIYEQSTFFGDLEIIDEIQEQENFIYHKQKKRRQFSVQCMSDQGICFKMSNFKFRKLVDSHRQILEQLSGTNKKMSQWLGSRIGQLNNTKLLTKQVLQVSPTQNIIKKANNWQKDQDEVKAKLLEQHKTATKYLEDSLIMLNQRIKKEEKERNQKVFDMAKELSKMQEKRHQFLSRQLNEKKRKEQLNISKLESPQKQKSSTPLLNLDHQIMQVTLHSPTPRNKRNSLLSRQSERLQSSCSTPIANDSNHYQSFEETHLNPQYGATLTQRQSLLDRNNQKNENNVLQSINQSIQEQQKALNVKKLSQNTKIIIPIDRTPRKSKEQDRRQSIFKEEDTSKLQQSQDLDYGNKRRVISFLKRELEREQFPQFVIKSSIPIREYSQKNLQNSLACNTLNSCYTDNTISQEDISQNQKDSFIKSFSKLRVNSVLENHNLQSPQLKINTDLLLKSCSIIPTSRLSNINSTTMKKSVNILKQITAQTDRRYQKQNLQVRLPSRSFTNNNNSAQNIKVLTNLAASKNAINTNIYFADTKDFSNLSSKPRSITNYEPKLRLLEHFSDSKQASLLNQTNDANKLDLTFMGENEDNVAKIIPQSTKIQKLPLKYFIPQYKPLQKAHRGIVNHNITPQKPLNTESLKIISPRLFAS